MTRRSSQAAWTRPWLVPLMLSLHGTAPAIDGASAPDLRPALLEVSVNGQRSPEPMLLLQDSQGGLYANAAALRQWRLRVPASAALRFEGEDWYRLDGLPSVRTRYSAQDQAVAIEAGPELFERQVEALAAPEQMEMTPAATGGFFNYDVFLEHALDETNLSGAFELGAFSPRGVGVATFIGGVGGGGSRLVRLDTSWTIDRPASLTTIRLGDGVSSVGPGGVPIRFGGIQYGRNFAIQPGYVTMPLPALEGSAAVPSVVDVYVNSALQGSRDVMPGPFEITDVPIQSGGGTVQFVVRDLLGREVVSEQSYYASAAMLRSGLHDFSYEIGFVRRGFGRSSAGYGRLMASTAHRYGLTDSVTVEGHAQASESVQMGGIAATAALFDLGLVGGSVSISHSPRGTGARIAASAERRTSGLSFGIRSEYSSRDYAFIGMSESERPTRMTVQAFADMPFRNGSAGVNFIRRDNRGRPDESLAGIFASYRIARSASLQLYARRVTAGDRQTIVGAHLAFALGGRRSTSAGIERRGRAIAGHASFQQDPPSGTGDGYRVSATAGPVESVDAHYAHQFRSATVGAHVSHSNGRSGVRLSAAGGIGLIGSRLFASRTIGSSFAAVEVGDHPNVRVYADNQLVGVTDDNGTAIVPAMRAFERNVIRIEEGDLPIDVQLAASEVAVRPFGRTGTVVSFAAHRERGVVLQIRTEDGGFLPAGATLRVEGDPTDYVAVSGGEAYLPNISGTVRVRASWHNQSCSFTATVPANDDPQPRLEGLVCARAGTYAAR